MDYEDAKSVFGFLLPNKNGSYNLIWNMLYHIRLLKYVRQEDLKLINGEYSKVCSKEKIKQLSELGYFDFSDGIVIAKDQVLEILKLAGKNIKILPKSIEGKGDINQLNNTSVFIQALKLPNFHHLFYPRFPIEDPYIIPDALLVLKEETRYKLIFLEIEAEKPNWEKYLEQKKFNYIRLSKDPIVYKYWCNCCELLSIEKPLVNKFKFSVQFITKIKLDFGQGFTFVEQLC